MKAREARSGGIWGSQLECLPPAIVLLPARNDPVIHRAGYPWSPHRIPWGWASTIGFLEEVGIPVCDGGEVTNFLHRDRAMADARLLVHELACVGDRPCTKSPVIHEMFSTSRG